MHSNILRRTRSVSSRLLVIFSLLLSSPLPVEAQDQTIPFLADKTSEELVLSTVRIHVNPRAPHLGSGVMIDIDRKSYPHVLKEGEIAILTAGHVAQSLDWRREIEVEGFAFTGEEKARRIGVTKRFTARILALRDGDQEDLALIAATISPEEFKTLSFRLAEVAPTTYKYRLDETLILVGCPEGKLPDVAKAYPAQLGGAKGRELLHVSVSRLKGHSGGPAFNEKREVTGICTGCCGEATSLALGFGLHGEKADSALKEGKNESKNWGLFVPLFRIDSLLQAAEREAEALEKLEKALQEYQKARNQR